MSMLLVFGLPDDENISGKLAASFMTSSYASISISKNSDDYTADKTLYPQEGTGLLTLYPQEGTGLLTLYPQEGTGLLTLYPQEGTGLLTLYQQEGGAPLI